MVKLVNESPLFAMDQEFMDLFYSKKPADCILHSEDGIQFKIHREILSQTELMQDILTSAKESCCQPLEIICPCSKVELAYVVKFLYEGQLKCDSSFDFANVLEILTKVFGFPKKFLHEWQEEFEITENVSDKPNSENDITNSTKIFDVDFNIDIKNELDLDSIEEIAEKENDITSTKIFDVDFNIDIKDEFDLDSIEEGLSNPIVIPVKPKKFNSDDIKETSHSCKDHTCKICNKKYTTRSHLVRHEKIHMGVKPYSCKYCQLKFSQKAYVNYHEKVHIKKGHNIRINTEDGTYFCKFCKKDFAALEALKLHEEFHKSKDHTCKICNKKLSTRSHLVRHERIHKGEIVYSCKYCQTKFSTQTNCKRHEKVHIANLMKPEDFPNVETEKTKTPQERGIFSV